MTDAPASAAEATQDNPHVEVDGNTEHGWITQVHDGEVAHVFTMLAETAEAAKAEALRLFNEAMGRAPPAPAKEGDGAPSAA